MDSALRLGDSFFLKAATQGEFTRFVKDHMPESDTLIVKAYWVGLEEGSMRDLDTLRCAVDAARGKVIVVEGHQIWRQELEESKALRFTAKDGEREWGWLMEKEG